jgi:hypothetical protein
MTTGCRSRGARPDDGGRSDGDERARDDGIERETAGAMMAARASIPACAGAELEATVDGVGDGRAVPAVAARDDDDVMAGRGSAARAGGARERERCPEHEDEQMEREQRERQRALHDQLHALRDSTRTRFERVADWEK